METVPSEDPQGAAEETVEVDDEKELVGYLNAPNKDTNTPPFNWMACNSSLLTEERTQLSREPIPWLLKDKHDKYYRQN